MKILTLILLITFGISSIAVAKETLIPRSVSGDKGQYYLIEFKKRGKIITAIHKRVGVYATDYTRTETNCGTMQMRELGTGEGSISNIKIQPTKWFDLVQGSSKSDLANYLCKK